MPVTINGTTGIAGVDGSAGTPAVQGGDTNTGMFFPAADTIAFAEGGAEVMRIDSSGNVGIGTSSPSALGRLTLSSSASSNYTSITAGSVTSLVGTDSSGLALSALGANNVVLYTGGTERMRIDSSGNVGIGVTPSAWGTSNSVKAFQTPAGAVWNFATTNLYFSQGFFFNGSSRIYLTTGTGVAEYSQQADTHVWASAGSGTAGNTVSLTERMRIDSSGNLLVGTTTAAARLTVQQSGSNDVIRVNIGTAAAGYVVIGSGSTMLPAYFATNGGVTFAGQISCNNNTTTYNTGSDYRLKHDIQPMTGALAKVAALKPVTYKWNVDDSAGEGFIAHELQAVVPQCVTGEKDAVDAEGNPVYQGIDTSFLVATLTAAIQEQQALIESLTARIAALEAA